MELVCHFFAKLHELLARHTPKDGRAYKVINEIVKHIFFFINQATA